ncbi:MAG TPA: sigma 54-interacting transcriptional regulator, partial [Pseudolabrys sp.]|nr:sigma 54-interacting transcriptional regulator [Pseudolabrys sp.]
MRTIDNGNIIESLLDTHETPAVIIGKDYRIVAANRAYCASYGVDPKEVVGRPCHEISHRSPVPCHLNGEACPHERVLLAQKPFEVLHTHYDRANHPDHVRIKAYPVHAADGQPFVVETIHRLAPTIDLNCEEMRMVGHSPAFLGLIENLSAAARSDAPVLLYGETGVGKELAAQFVHKQSGRHCKPYVELNCAAIPEALCESELFGHERGAFTGCVGLKKGLFESANGGTLFLDEIAEMPLLIQAKLLRALDTGEFRRVGGSELMKTDVRVVAATNKNLMAMVEQRHFREDLYFRLAGINVNIPPLRERRMDIPALAEVLVRRLSQHRDQEFGLAPDAIERLANYDFPGNVRELRNILQRAIALTGHGVITGERLVFGESPEPDRSPADADASGEPADASLEAMEARHIRGLLHQYKGNRSRVAAVLGVAERTLYRK